MLLQQAGSRKLRIRRATTTLLWLASRRFVACPHSRVTVCDCFCWSTGAPSMVPMASQIFEPGPIGLVQPFVPPRRRRRCVVAQTVSTYEPNCPTLSSIISLSIGPVRRVVYDPTIWPDAPSRIIRGTAVTAVDPYTLVANDTIYLHGHAFARRRALRGVARRPRRGRPSPTPRGVQRGALHERVCAAAPGGTFRGRGQASPTA